MVSSLGQGKGPLWDRGLPLWSRLCSSSTGLFLLCRHGDTLGTPSALTFRILPEAGPHLSSPFVSSSIYYWRGHVDSQRLVIPSWTYFRTQVAPAFGGRSH